MTNRKQLADLTAGQPKKYAQRMWLTIHGMRQECLRLELIEWLEWNDPNGVYNDIDCRAEFGRILRLDELLESVTDQYPG